MISAVAQTLVLLHGFTHTGQSWEPVAQALGERYRPIAPDLRGHGAASELEPVALEPVLADIERLSTESFVLAGYSMGGRLALHFALARPQRVTRLVLIGASPGIAEDSEREARLLDDERLAAELQRGSIEDFARRWARTPVLADQPLEVQARVHADRLRNDPQGLARALRGLGTGALPPLWERLGDLGLPVLLIVGERDRKFAQIAQEMARALPDARLEVVPGAGHAVHLEQPGAVAALIAGP